MEEKEFLRGNLISLLGTRSFVPSRSLFFPAVDHFFSSFIYLFPLSFFLFSLPFPFPPSPRTFPLSSRIQGAPALILESRYASLIVL